MEQKLGQKISCHLICCTAKKCGVMDPFCTTLEEAQWCFDECNGEYAVLKNGLWSFGLNFFRALPPRKPVKLTPNPRRLQANFYGWNDNAKMLGTFIRSWAMFTVVPLLASRWWMVRVSWKFLCRMKWNNTPWKCAPLVSALWKTPHRCLNPSAANMDFWEPQQRPTRF